LYRLADLVSKPGDQLRYTYDLGDQFIHVLTVEAVVPDDDTFELFDGALAGPPEDSNGSENMGNRAYQKLLRDAKEKGVRAMTTALREAASASNIKPSQLDSKGRFQPFRFEVMKHRFAVQAALAEPLGARTTSMPKLQTFNLRTGTIGSSAPPPCFGGPTTAYDPETLGLTALCGVCTL
jgi:hypothetical protein